MPVCDMTFKAEDKNFVMVAQRLIGNKTVKVLEFRDPAAGKVGPIAWQMHNAGLFDEYKEVTIEPDPPDNQLISTK